MVNARLSRRAALRGGAGLLVGGASLGVLPLFGTPDRWGRTVRDLLDDLERQYPGLTDGVVNGDGLHRFVNLYVNGEDVRYSGALETPVKEGDTVAILPAVAGGSKPGGGTGRP